MKTLSFIAVLFFGVIFNNNTLAQSQKETIKVWGNCGMCKTRIETAALSAGASKASWDSESHDLAVKFDAKKTSAMAIQEAIAKVGHDTRDVTADEGAYNNLHGCCKYERKSAEGSASAKKCCKDGNKSCAKDAGDKKCAKEGKGCCKEGGDKNCKKDEKSCSKDSGDKKCAKEGKGCCKEGGDKNCKKDEKSCSKGADMKCGAESACCKESGDKKCCAEGQSCCKESGDKKCCGACKG
jgi:hypothetical protein